MNIELKTVPVEVAFVDDAEIEPYALEAVAAIASVGIISGKDGNRLDPKGNATRAEVATMLHRLVTIM